MTHPVQRLQAITANVQAACLAIDRLEDDFSERVRQALTALEEAEKLLVDEIEEHDRKCPRR